MEIAFQSEKYELRKQVLALTGILRISNDTGQLLLYCRQKMFQLREDIRVYADEYQTRELLNIKARQILDFSAYYEVTDSTDSSKVGGLRRRGLRSLIQDEWEVFDAHENLIGLLKEDSIGQALLRRLLLGNLLPQNYDLLVNSEKVADIKQVFNPFRYTLRIDFQLDRNKVLDRRLGIAAAILLAIIEGRQEK